MTWSRPASVDVRKPKPMTNFIVKLNTENAREQVYKNNFTSHNSDECELTVNG